MPYKKITDANKALRGIEPSLTLAQMNLVASWADTIGGEKAWAFAIANFKKTHVVKNGRWVRKPQKEESVNKEIEQPAENDVAENESIESYFPAYSISATSFEQWEQERLANEIKESIGELFEVYQRIQENIIWSQEIIDKVSAIRQVTEDFISRIQEIQDADSGGDEEPQDYDMESSETETQSLAETIEGTSVLVEGDGGKSDLLYLDTVIIRPGWGNARDNNYYPREMLARDSSRFVGAKMYETDHRQEEKSTRTWVSTIESIKGYTDDGAPIARVVVHDPDFAQRIRNLNAAGLIEKMECSILAEGRAKPFEQDGKRGKLVEQITGVSSVDWVTKAGAGGRAVGLSESNTGGEQSMDETQKEKQEEVVQEAVTETVESDSPVADSVVIHESEPEPEPIPLTPETVSAFLSATRLPTISRERLSRQVFYTESALAEAVEEEIEYIKEVAKSGEPFGLSENHANSKKAVDLAEVERLKDAVNRKYLS